MTVLNALYAPSTSGSQEVRDHYRSLVSTVGRCARPPIGCTLHLRPRSLRKGHMSRLPDFEPLTMCHPESKSVRTAFVDESGADLSALNRLQTASAKRILHLFSRVCAGILLWLVLPSAAFASCTPPPKMRAEIEAKPTAETYANLG